MPENIREDSQDAALDPADTAPADAEEENGGPDLLSDLSDLLEAEGESLEDEEAPSADELTEELLFADADDQDQPPAAADEPDAGDAQAPRRQGRRPARAGRSRQGAWTRARHGVGEAGPPG